MVLVALVTFALTALVAAAVTETVRAQDSRNAIGPSVLDGVYTAAQARRGQEQFEQQCASCHRRDLSGFSAPPLKGERFLDQWREFPFAVLFNVMRTQMPLGNPGGLPARTYLDVAAYVLEANGLPPGRAELTDDVAAKVLLVGPAGPQPLPTSSPAMVAGCMTKEPGTGWFLTHATDPVRTLDAFAFTDADLRTATQAGSGQELIRLQNLEELPGSTEAADRLIGRKIAAKGILVRHEKGTRLNVGALSPIADTCEPQADAK